MEAQIATPQLTPRQVDYVKSFGDGSPDPFTLADLFNRRYQVFTGWEISETGVIHVLEYLGFLKQQHAGAGNQASHKFSSHSLAQSTPGTLKQVHEIDSGDAVGKPGTIKLIHETHSGNTISKRQLSRHGTASVTGFEQDARKMKATITPAATTPAGNEASSAISDVPEIDVEPIASDWDIVEQEPDWDML